MSGRIAYIETHFAGSHARIARLLRRHSRHQIEIVPLRPGQWRWRTLTAHHDVAALIERRGLPTPDAMILSGPIQVPGLLALLPGSWSRVPRAVYFHESQWTYPTAPYDPRPYLVSHLDAVRVADQVWFNSSYHRDTFLAAAIGDRSSRIRSLARRVVADHWQAVEVLYPPVEVDQSLAGPVRPAGAVPRICWVARWEAEKRPDLFVEAIERLRAAHADVEVAVFLGGSRRPLAGDPLYERIAGRDVLERAPVGRTEYERELAHCDILVSTAAHEFFGVAAIEAAMLDVIPLLPADLAYPETLPSAPRYPPGDLDALVAALNAITMRKWRGRAPWQRDSSRFTPERTVPAYDRAIDALLQWR